MKTEDYLKNILYSQLRSRAIKALLLNLGRFGTGPIGFVVTFIAGHFLDKLVEPAFDYVVRKIKIQKLKKEIDDAFKELNEAENESDWNDAADNIK